MPLDVQDPALNLVLNACLYGMGLVALVSILPVPTRRWMPAALPLLALGLYVAYEAAMPRFRDIRLDLLLILPFVTITFIASGVRFYLLRRAKNPDT